MTLAAAPDEPTVIGRLDDRVLVVLQELPGRIAFSGLRRSLRAHPESLARALRRLEREGLIERSASGYRAIPLPTGRPIQPLAGLRGVAQVEVPPGVDADAILQRLSGRWFGSLRWMGVVDRSHDRLLAWAHRDGTGTVLLGHQRGQLRIYTTTPPGLEEDGDADDAAYELLVALADTLRPAASDRNGGPPRSSGVATLQREWADSEPTLAPNN